MRDSLKQLKVADQGEDGIVEGDNVDDAFMTKLFDLLAAHRVWSRSSKIDQIPACRWRLRLPGLHCFVGPVRRSRHPALTDP
jgi:hypothetical protein